MFSTKVRYALKAAVTLSRLQAYPGGERAVTVREVANEGELRFAFLAKVVAELASARVLKTRKGPGGGILLSKAPADLSMAEVVYAVDKVDDLTRCLLDDRPCREFESCQVHGCFSKIRINLLEETSIAELDSSNTLCKVAFA